MARRHAVRFELNGVAVLVLGLRVDKILQILLLFRQRDNGRLRKARRRIVRRLVGSRDRIGTRRRSICECLGTRALRKAVRIGTITGGVAAVALAEAAARVWIVGHERAQNVSRIDAGRERRQRNTRGELALIIPDDDVDQILRRQLESVDLVTRHRARDVEHQRDLEVRARIPTAGDEGLSTRRDRDGGMIYEAQERRTDNGLADHREGRIDHVGRELDDTRWVARLVRREVGQRFFLGEFQAVLELPDARRRQHRAVHCSLQPRPSEHCAPVVNGASDDREHDKNRKAEHDGDRTAVVLHQPAQRSASRPPHPNSLPNARHDAYLSQD